MKSKIFLMLTFAALFATFTACTNECSELDPPFSLSTPKGSGSSYGQDTGIDTGDTISCDTTAIVTPSPIRH